MGNVKILIFVYFFDQKTSKLDLNIPYTNKNYFTSNKNLFEKSLILAYVTLLRPWIVPLITKKTPPNID